MKLISLIEWLRIKFKFAGWMPSLVSFPKIGLVDFRFHFRQFPFWREKLKRNENYNGNQKQASPISSILVNLLSASIRFSAHPSFIQAWINRHFSLKLQSFLPLSAASIQDFITHSIFHSAVWFNHSTLISRKLIAPAAFLSFLFGQFD